MPTAMPFKTKGGEYKETCRTSVFAKQNTHAPLKTTNQSESVWKELHTKTNDNTKCESSSGLKKKIKKIPAWQLAKVMLPLPRAYLDPPAGSSSLPERIDGSTATGSHDPKSSEEGKNTRRRLEKFTCPDDENAPSTVLLRFPSSGEKIDRIHRKNRNCVSPTRIRNKIQMPRICCKILG